jgi:hypothetical protein
MTINGFRTADIVPYVEPTPQAPRRAGGAHGHRAGDAHGQWWLAPVLAAVALAAAAVIVHVLGVAGYRGGWFWTGALLAVLPVAVVLRGLPNDGVRTMWMLALATIALVTTAWLVDHAPLSKGALAARLDRLVPPFSTTVSETRSGHSWCRPHCPRVTTVLKTPDRAPFAALFDVAAQFRLAGLMDNLEPVGRRHPVKYVRAVSYRVIAEVRATPKDGYLELRITLSARRARVHHQGPVQTDRTVNLSTR